MTTKELHERHSTRPFVPFEIGMADGKRYEVRHPEQMAYMPGARTCAVYADDGVFRILDLLLMTSVGPLAPRPRKRRAG